MLYIIGSGGHAKVIANASQVIGIPFRFIDCQGHEGNLDEETFLAMGPAHLPSEVKIICGIGSTGSLEKRRDTITRYKEFSHLFGNALHPSSVLAADVKLGSGIFVAQGVQLVNGVVIEDHALINTAAVIDHDSFIGEGTHIGPGAILCGSITCGKWVHVGSGSVIIQGTKIADGIVIGAGTVVNRSLSEPHSTWVGSPARRIR
jgi:sugar O-acyltransferase (sialic acid O-acetyltransferase NeuD family)